MTEKYRDEIREEVIEKLYEIFLEYGIDWEDFFNLLGDKFREGSTHESHPIVKSLLLAIVESMERASFDYYCSTK